MERKRVFKFIGCLGSLFSIVLPMVMMVMMAVQSYRFGMASGLPQMQVLAEAGRVLLIGVVTLVVFQWALPGQLPRHRLMLAAGWISVIIAVPLYVPAVSKFPEIVEMLETDGRSPLFTYGIGALLAAMFLSSVWRLAVRTRAAWRERFRPDA